MLKHSRCVTHDAFDLFFKKKKKYIYIYIYIYLFIYLFIYKNIQFSFPEVKADIYNLKLQNLFFTSAD